MKKQKVQVIITLFGSIPDEVKVFAEESDAMEFYIKKAKKFGVEFDGEVTKENLEDFIDAVSEQLQMDKDEIHWYETEVE